MGKKVLIAVDGSEESQKAFDWYLQYLHRDGNSVVLGHVADVTVHPTYAFRAGLAVPAEDWKKMIKEAEDKVRQIEKHFSSILRAKGIPHVFKFADGHAGPHLCEFAKQEKVNYVVMGTRGLGTVRRTILGSVSDYVLHHVHVPVCIYR